MGNRTSVCIVDADPCSLRAMRDAMERAKLRVQTFTSETDLLGRHGPADCGCLVFDLGVMGCDDLSVLDRLAARGVDLPIVFVTEEPGTENCLRALKLGGIAWLGKSPLDERGLLDMVRMTLRRRAAAHAEAVGHSRAWDTVPHLTPRERQVLESLVAGRTLKEIAKRFSVSVQSVWRHRQKIWKKFGVANDVQLARRVLARGMPQRPRSEDAARP